MAKAFTKLHRDELRKLKPGEKRTEHGITFERLASGDGLYTVNVMVDGIRIHRTIGRESEGVTRTQAEAFIEQARTDARHDRLTLPKGRKTALSFKDAAHKYLKRLAESGGKNMRAKDQHLHQHLIPFFGDQPLSKVVAFDVERYKKHRLAQEVHAGGSWRNGQWIRKPTGRTTSPATLNRELATLGHMLNCAIEWEWIKARPKAKLLKEGDGRIVYLTPDQVQRFLDACQQSDNPQLHPFALIALETSMRMMEVLSIRVEHVNLAQHMIYIPQAKAGAREQPITDNLAQYLATYMAQAIPSGSEWLFPSAKSQTGHTVAIQKPFKRAAVEAGLDPAQVVRHTLRHTAVSHLVQSGVDLPTVQRISGHKTLAMVVRYAHQDGQHIRAAMDKLQNRLAGRKTA